MHLYIKLLFFKTSIQIYILNSQFHQTVQIHKLLIKHDLCEYFDVGSHWFVIIFHVQFYNIQHCSFPVWWCYINTARIILSDLFFPPFTFSLRLYIPQLSRAIQFYFLDYIFLRLCWFPFTRFLTLLHNIKHFWTWGVFNLNIVMTCIQVYCKGD